MNAFDMFKMDPNKESGIGVILDYGAFRVRIARAGGSNKKFGKLLEARLKPYKYQLDREIMNDEVAAQITREVYAETIILGWDVQDPKDPEKYIEGIMMEDGSIVPVTKENLIAIFKALPELFRDIQSQSNKLALFRVADLEEEVKN